MKKAQSDLKPPNGKMKEIFKQIDEHKGVPRSQRVLKLKKFIVRIDKFQQVY